VRRGNTYEQGESRRAKEMDGCPLTLTTSHIQKTRWLSAHNPNTTQTLEYTKDKYNAKIIK
jgi:hypothetical protein